MKKTAFCLIILIFTACLTAVPDQRVFYNTNFHSGDFIPQVYNQETYRTSQFHLPLQIQPYFSSSLRSWRLQRTIETNIIGGSPDFKADFYYNSIYTNRLDSILVMISTTESPSVSAVWEPYVRIQFTYDQNSQNLINYSQFNLSSGISLLTLDLDYVYNQDGICTDGYQSLYYDDVQSLIPVRRLHVFYNNEGIDCLYWWAYDHGYDLTYYSRITYNYDSSGRPSVIKEEVSSDSLTWQNNFRTAILYHPSDTGTGADFVNSCAHPENPFPALFQPLRSSAWSLVEQAQSDYWNDSDWSPYSKTIFAYNENDILLIEIVMYYAGGWQNLYHYMQTLDNNSLPIFLTFREWYDYWHNWDSPIQQDEFFWEQVTGNEENALPSSSLSVFASPNPFSNELSVSYTVSKAGPVSVAIYNLKGQKVQTLSSADKANGTYSLSWNGKDANGQPAASGVYLIRVSQNELQVCRKVLRMR